MIAESEFSPEQWRFARYAAASMLALAIVPENLAGSVALGALAILFFRWKDELRPFRVFVEIAMAAGLVLGSLREGGLTALPRLWFPVVGLLRYLIAHRH
ncbi:MAG TPA: hypothetical protein VF316_10560 [Polyangiaceae bacterium]